MCPHTTQCVHIPVEEELEALYTHTHTHTYMCVLILRHMCAQLGYICVLILGYIFVLILHYICVLSRRFWSRKSAAVK